MDVSVSSGRYYGRIPHLVPLPDAPSAFVRTRAFLVIAAQARWERPGGRLETALPRMPALLGDPKPTVVWQCLSALGPVARCCPWMADSLRDAASAVDPGRYKDTAGPLIGRDKEKPLRSLAEAAT